MWFFFFIYLLRLTCSDHWWGLSVILAELHVQSLEVHLGIYFLSFCLMSPVSWFPQWLYKNGFVCSAIIRAQLHYSLIQIGCTLEETWPGACLLFGSYFIKMTPNFILSSCFWIAVAMVCFCVVLYSFVIAVLVCTVSECWFYSWLCFLDPLTPGSCLLLICLLSPDVWLVELHGLNACLSWPHWYFYSIKLYWVPYYMFAQLSCIDAPLTKTLGKITWLHLCFFFYTDLLALLDRTLADYFTLPSLHLLEKGLPAKDI